MRAKELGFVLVFLLVVIVAVACSPSGTSQKATEKTDAAPPADTVAAATVPQLESNGREDAATMVLLNAPPVLPADHKNFWQEKLRQESCMVCHATPETGAPLPTPEHYYDNQQGGKIFRDTCIQCHATQNDTKSAFNEK
ncbi:nitrate reductase cytochrome c-type subunit [Schinkia azotoformans]|uniref:NapB n=1 Tax=Schinkia azotoformans LMG 9581 TaxID=1131731 RepID=K6DTA9_SCHAZ|nr:nitrate reductase cytochrome c-type subunit [Schinkia azotoformans]EKN63996.1 napB [Schinkia azotoformans LMG 9581]MEC1640569.1 nitrate reductase cytochrome c-type subunit [Schinkia azotoformans]MEC1719416.1 nitrate reductase cytochrome c-type subunit [Schinkia azotoformans]MEC1944546.1 nitrate reductase cytochrome c-type subunit [Schinkia azotoformans]MED4353442.1 nitrate reductase cytochrome c-type subunit [Schinkia azotoformans]